MLILNALMRTEILWDRQRDVGWCEASVVLFLTPLGAVFSNTVGKNGCRRYRFEWCNLCAIWVVPRKVWLSSHFWGGSFFVLQGIPISNFDLPERGGMKCCASATWNEAVPHEICFAHEIKFALRIKNMRFAHFMFSQKTFHGASHFICLQGKFHCAPRRAKSHFIKICRWWIRDHIFALNSFLQYCSSWRKQYPICARRK